MEPPQHESTQNGDISVSHKSASTLAVIIIRRSDEINDIELLGQVTGHQLSSAVDNEVTMKSGCKGLIAQTTKELKYSTSRGLSTKLGAALFRQLRGHSQQIMR